MRKPAPSLRERIAVRAYFEWLNMQAIVTVDYMTADYMTAEDYWLRAECVELALAEKRSASAKKAAATRAIKKQDDADLAGFLASGTPVEPTFLGKAGKPMRDAAMRSARKAAH